MLAFGFGGDAVLGRHFDTLETADGEGLAVWKFRLRDALESALIDHSGLVPRSGIGEVGRQRCLVGEGTVGSGFETIEGDANRAT